jgi:hypothetical protein
MGSRDPALCTDQKTGERAVNPESGCHARGMRGSVPLVGVVSFALLSGTACMGEGALDDLDDDEIIETMQLPLASGGLTGGEPCDAVLRGARAFLDRDLDGTGGNGRSCADCHMAIDRFQLSPASAEARFRRLQARLQHNPDADDPLFRPIDADDFRLNGENASDFSNLRENGLVRITFPLPPTVKLIDPATGLPSSETEVDVWRSVPSILNVKRTGPAPDPPAWFRPPNPQGGYQLDARVATLQEQALGAFTRHAEVQHAPSGEMLDDLASFENVVFSSQRMFLASRAIDQGITPVPDPDPRLTSLERRGKTVFLRACAQCHGGVGGNQPAPDVFRFGTVQAQCPRPVDFQDPPRFRFATCPPRLARNARTYEIQTPNGPIRRTTSDPGRTLLSGFAGGPPPLDDWNALDAPSTRGISRTAPYFHNNSAATLEEVLDHYTELFKFVAAFSPPSPVPRPSVISTDGIHDDRPFTQAERPALLAYLRRL